MTTSTGSGSGTTLAATATSPHFSHSEISRNLIQKRHRRRQGRFGILLMLTARQRTSSWLTLLIKSETLKLQRWTISPRSQSTCGSAFRIAATDAPFRTGWKGQDTSLSEMPMHRMDCGKSTTDARSFTPELSYPQPSSSRQPAR